MSYSPEFGHQIGQKARFLMECQARTGVVFDLELAKKTLVKIDKEMAELEERLKPHLPEVQTAKKDLIKMPKRRFKTGKKGLEKSAYVVKFEAEHNKSWTLDELRELPEDYVLNPISEFDLWSSNHMAELKQKLMVEFGWRPVHWNFKKKDGKFIYDEKTRERIKSTPKFQKDGELCPNLELLGEHLSFVKDIVRWVMCKHRRGVLITKDGTGGWINNDRVLREGRISARSSGYTNTQRQKHTVVCNVVGVDKPYGKEHRACFTVPEGKVAVGYDAGSLEAVTKAHYSYKYDSGEYARKIFDPKYDDHIETALGWGLITQEMADLFIAEKSGQISKETAENHRLWKPMKAGRSDAKPGNYGLQYNQQVKGLAETYGIPLDEAQLRYDTYWEINHGWKSCQDALTRHWEMNGRRGIQCPLSGLFLYSRSQHSLGSLLIQHTGAFIMDYAGVILDKWLGGIKLDRARPYYRYKGYECARVIYYHDEYMWESDPEIAEELLELGKESIREAARRLKLRVPLDADGSIGRNWSCVH